MSSPPVYINTNDKVDTKMVTTIVIPEDTHLTSGGVVAINREAIEWQDIRQDLSAVRSDTYKCMTDIYNLRQDYNNYIKSGDTGLEERVSNLEKIVWRLEDYIENGIDTK